MAERAQLHIAAQEVQSSAASLQLHQAKQHLEEQLQS